MKQQNTTTPVKGEGYTKGEWSLKPSSVERGWYVFSVDTLFNIGFIYNQWRKESINIANAKLIASAPQLKADNERLLAANKELSELLKEVSIWFPTNNPRTEKIMNKITEKLLKYL